MKLPLAFAVVLLLPLVGCHGLSEKDLVGKWTPDSGKSNLDQMGMLSSSEVDLKENNTYNIKTYPDGYIRGIWHLRGTIINFVPGKVVIEQQGKTIELPVGEGSAAYVPYLPEGPDKDKEAEILNASFVADFDVTPDGKTMTSKFLVLHKAG